MDSETTPIFRTNVTTVNAISNGRVAVNRIIWHNDDNAIRFMQVFNAKAADVTLGTTVADFAFQIAADVTVVVPMGNAVFGTALSIAITSDSTGSTTGTANKVVVVIH